MKTMTARFAFGVCACLLLGPCLVASAKAQGGLLDEIAAVEQSLRDFGETLRAAQPFGQANNEEFFLDMLETSRNRLLVLAPVLRSLVEVAEAAPKGETDPCGARLGPAFAKIRELSINEAFLASEIVNANDGVSAETTTLVGEYLEIVSRFTAIPDRCLGMPQER